MSFVPIQLDRGSIPRPLLSAWNLLCQRSVLDIDKGLAKFSEIVKESPAIADQIFESVGINAQSIASGGVVYILSQGQFLACEDEANPYFIYALLGMLSRAPRRGRGEDLKRAIHSLELICPAIPELRGFDNLVDLRLFIDCPEGGSKQSAAYALADRIGPIPCLERLELSVSAGNGYRLDCLERLPTRRLKIFKANGIGLHSIQGLEAIKGLHSVDLSHNHELEDLGPLIGSANSLSDLDLSNTGIKDVGALCGLHCLERLSLVGCFGLHDLNGLESCNRLLEVRVGPHAIDFKAISSIPNTWLCIDFAEVNADCLQFSDDLLDALSSVPRLRLKITNFNSVDNLKCLDALGLESLSRIPHLRALDLSDLESIDHVGFALAFYELELFKVAPRSRLSKAIGGCTFDTKSKMDRLKLLLLAIG